MSNLYMHLFKKIKVGLNNPELTIRYVLQGGSIFNIAQELKLPIHYIGVGETVDDLKQFNSEEFVNSILE